MCRNGSEAKKFCLNHDCPEDPEDANEENCCLHHINVHSCARESVCCIVAELAV